MDDRTSTEAGPPTERVPAGRGMPLLVALAVISALVLFVARPWQDRAPSPTSVALASPTHPASPGAAPSPTQVPTPTPTAPPPVLPPPDLGPLDAPGQVALSTDGTPVVRCSYGRVRHGLRMLVGVTVSPPIVTLDPGAAPTDISHVSWRFVLEMNQQQSVFEKEWQAVGASRTQATGTAEGRAAGFTPLEMQPRVELDTSVYRVRLVVEWFTRNLEPAGQVEVLAAPYREGTATRRADLRPYCSGALRSS